MEQKIRDYEKFIAREAKRDYGTAERKRLLKMHQLMLENFQHERMIHLRVTLFFAFMAVEFALITMWSTPHTAWGSADARDRLVKCIAEHIRNAGI